MTGCPRKSGERCWDCDECTEDCHVCAAYRYRPEVSRSMLLREVSRARHKITGVAALGFLAGAFVGAMYSYSWAGVIVTGALTAAACALAMVIQCANERRRWRRVWR